MTPLAEIARAAWMASEGDYWEDTVKAVRAAVIDECVEAIEEATSRNDARGVKRWSRVNVLRALKENSNG